MRNNDCIKNLKFNVFGLDTYSFQGKISHKYDRIKMLVLPNIFLFHIRPQKNPDFDLILLWIFLES